MARCFTLFQLVFSLSIAFSTSLEGSIIEMKPATPVPVDTAVTLTAHARRGLKIAKGDENMTEM